MEADKTYGPVVGETIDNIHALIEKGGVQIGGKLPSERELAELFCVSRSSVREAIAQMREAGEVESRRGRRGGTFILDTGPYWHRYGRMDIQDRADLMIDRLGGTIWSPSEERFRQNYQVETKVLSATLEPCPLEISELFSLEDSQSLYCIVRVRTAEGEPISYEHTYVDPHYCPGLLERDLSQSIAILIKEEYHAVIHRFDEKIEVIPARAKAAHYLKVANDFPLLRVLMHAVDVDGKTAFVSRDLYRSDHVRITVRNLLSH